MVALSVERVLGWARAMTCNIAPWLGFSSPGHTYHEYGSNIKAGSLMSEEIQILHYHVTTYGGLKSQKC